MGDKTMIMKALSELRHNCQVEVQFHNNGTYTILSYKHEQPLPTKEEIQAKIAELKADEPLRLLRIERDRLLQQTDWEIQRNTERNIDSTELITYRNALRDLPQEIESGNISAPTLDDQGNLIFDNWPVRGE